MYGAVWVSSLRMVVERKDGIAPLPEWLNTTAALEWSILRLLTEIRCCALVITSCFSSTSGTGAWSAAPKEKALAAAMEDMGVCTVGALADIAEPDGALLCGECRRCAPYELDEAAPSVLTDLDRDS